MVLPHQKLKFYQLHLISSCSVIAQRVTHTHATKNNTLLPTLQARRVMIIRTLLHCVCRTYDRPIFHLLQPS